MAFFYLRHPDHHTWLRHLGYDASSIMPHLNPKIRHNCLPDKKLSIPVQESLHAVSGVGCIIRVREVNLVQLTTLPLMTVKREPVLHHYVPRIHTASAPLGKGIVVSRHDKRAIVRAASEANNIYRDVMTSILNQSYFLDIHLLHQKHDMFFFVKENVWQVTADRNQLQRLGSSIVNYTVHNSDPDIGHDSHHVDVKIHTQGVILNIRYGTTYEQERQRVLRHAQSRAIREAWAMEKDRLLASYSGSREWTAVEIDEILQSGEVPGYYGEYIHKVEEYPELADDPLNIAFHRGVAKTRHRR